MSIKRFKIRDELTSRTRVTFHSAPLRTYISTIFTGFSIFTTFWTTHVLFLRIPFRGFAVQGACVPLVGMACCVIDCCIAADVVGDGGLRILFWCDSDEPINRDDGWKFDNTCDWLKTLSVGFQSSTLLFHFLARPENNLIELVPITFSATTFSRQGLSTEWILQPQFEGKSSDVRTKCIIRSEMEVARKGEWLIKLHHISASVCALFKVDFAFPRRNFLTTIHKLYFLLHNHNPNTQPVALSLNSLNFLLISLVQFSSRPFLNSSSIMSVNRLSFFLHHDLKPLSTHVLTTHIRPTHLNYS